MRFEISSVEEIADGCKKIIPHLPKGVVLVDGKMGAGKTTLISEICKQLGILDEPSSPTYSIVNEYVTKSNETIYHFDCYRLETMEEAIDIGIEDYLFSGNYCFIEWAEKIEKLLPDNYVRVKVQEEQGTRIITISNEDR